MHPSVINEVRNSAFQPVVSSLANETCLMLLCCLTNPLQDDMCISFEKSSAISLKTFDRREFDVDQWRTNYRWCIS